MLSIYIKISKLKFAMRLLTTRRFWGFQIAVYKLFKYDYNVLLLNLKPGYFLKTLFTETSALSMFFQEDDMQATLRK